MAKKADVRFLSVTSKPDLLGRSTRSSHSKKKWYKREVWSLHNMSGHVEWNLPTTSPSISNHLQLLVGNLKNILDSGFMALENVWMTHGFSQWFCWVSSSKSAPASEEPSIPDWTHIVSPSITPRDLVLRDFCHHWHRRTVERNIWLEKVATLFPKIIKR